MQGKNAVILIAISMFCGQWYEHSIQDPCNDEMIMQVKGSWKKHPDANMINDRNEGQVIARVDNISKLFQWAYPEPKGIEAAWFRTMSGNPLINGGPIPYEFNSSYKSWYCNQQMHNILLGAETGTWAYVCINSFGWFMTSQYDQLGLSLHGNTLYRLPPKIGTWKGNTLYQVRSWSNRNGCIILTHH